MADNFLSQDEVDALLQGVGEADDAAAAIAEASDARPYDLATQERIVRGRMPTLDLINERFARQFRIGLHNFLRRGVEITVGPVRVGKYSEFTDNLVVPASLNLVQWKPLRGAGLVVFNAELVFLMVDNLFGGDGRFQSQVDGRDFTQTEQRIIQRVLNLVFESYSKAWQPVYPVEFVHVRSETKPQFASIAAPNDVMVLTTFVVELGQVSGEMHVCIPYSTIKPIKGLLVSSQQTETVTVDRRWTQLMRQQIQMADVEIVADLGAAQINLRDIVNLKVGDVIPLAIPETIEARVDGVPVMECAYGKFNGQYTLRVEKLLSTSATDQPTGEQHV